jgi:hypothetical protein
VRVKISQWRMFTQRCWEKIPRRTVLVKNSTSELKKKPPKYKMNNE